MVLIDTNIVAYLLIEGDHTKTAQDLHRSDPDWRSEAFLLVEFTNVLATYLATKRMTLLLKGKLVRTADATVLATAAQYHINPNDARFLALAGQLGRRLVTEDAKLRAAAPGLTQSLAEALGSV